MLNTKRDKSHGQKEVDKNKTQKMKNPISLINKSVVLKNRAIICSVDAVF